MEVVSTGIIPASGFLWQPRPDAQVATIVAKATFLLEPGACRLAPQQEPLTVEDRYHDDDAGKSLRDAHDLVPVKPQVDVIVVGHAHAPGRRPVASLLARLVLGELAKAIEVHGDRAAASGGSVRGGAPFVMMPLIYERAGGGPANPVGMRQDARRPDGLVALPNLQRPGGSPFEPIGFGPIAPDWPERRERAAPSAGTFSPRVHDRGPFPDGFDLGFFNAAPRDQQLRVITAGQQLVLEHLHPEHAILATALPSFAPKAVVHRGGEPTKPLTLRADTLCIDADSGQCTITFRGSFGVETADEAVRVVVSVEGEARRPSSVQIRGAAAVLDATAELPIDFRAIAGALPFTSAASSIDRAAERSLWPSTPPAPSRIVAVLEPVIVRPDDVRARSAAPPVPPVVVIAGGIGSALEASNAAAGREAAAPPPKEAAAPPPVTAAGIARAEAQDVCDLIWFDAELPPRLRRRPEYRPIIDALEERPVDAELDEPVAARDPMLIEDRRDVFEVLVRGAAIGVAEVREAYRRATRDDGKFVPGLVLVAGEIETPLDEVAELEATVGIAAPFAAGDDALREPIAAAQELLRAPGGPPPAPLAASFTARIAEVLSRGKRASLELEAQRDATLIEQRRYQRRTVFGKKHIRGLLVTPKPRAPAVAPPPVPVYLADEVADLLPLLKRFRVRLIAEVRLGVDPREGHPFALRALAVVHAVSSERRS